MTTFSFFREKIPLGIALILMVICLQSWQVPFAHSDTKPRRIVMACPFDPDKNDNGRALKLIFTEAFKRLGYDMEYRYYPAARASYLADLGEVDGELVRGSKYYLNHPNLVRVEEPVITIRILAFSRNPDIKVQGWDSLTDTKYRVDYRIGHELITEQLTKRVPPENLTGVSQEANGIKKLLAGNTDLFIDNDRVVRQLLASGWFREELNEVFGLTAVYTAGVLDEDTIHTYLHKKHRALAKDLSVVMKKIKEEGLWDKLIQGLWEPRSDGDIKINEINGLGP